MAVGVFEKQKDKINKDNENGDTRSWSDSDDIKHFLDLKILCPTILLWPEIFWPEFLLH